MVSIPTDMEDMSYALSQDLANVLASSGFAEAALAFKHFDGDEVPAAKLAHLSLVEPVITQAEIDNEIQEVISRAGSSTHPLVVDAISMLQKTLGQPRSALSGIASDIERLTNKAQQAVSDMNDVDPQAALNARRAELYATNAEYRAAVDEIAKDVAKANDELNASTADYDAQLKAKGIKTPQDEELARIDAEIEDARVNAPWKMADLGAKKAQVKQAQIEYTNTNHPGAISPAANAQANQAANDMAEKAEAAQAAQKAEEERIGLQSEKAFAKEEKAPIAESFYTAAAPTESRLSANRLGGNQIVVPKDPEVAAASLGDMPLQTIKTQPDKSTGPQLGG